MSKTLFDTIRPVLCAAGLDDSESHEDGEPIATCTVCGEVTRHWAKIQLQGAPCLAKSRRECACERAKREARERAEAERARHKRLALAFSPEDVPADFEGTTLGGWGDQNTGVAVLGRRVIECFDEDRDSTLGFVLCGKTGIGKTRLLYCLVEELASRKVSVRYVSWPRLTMRVKATFSRSAHRGHQSQASIVDDLTSARFLLLDELGFGSTGDWQRELLFELVEGATRHGTALVCATTLGERALQAWLTDPATKSPRIYNRLAARSPIMQGDGVDMRRIQGDRALQALLGGTGGGQG